MIESEIKQLIDFLEIKESVDFYDSYSIPTPCYFTKNNLFCTSVYKVSGLSEKEFLVVAEKEFQESFDWLMLVVDKIESLSSKFHGKFQVYIYGNTCEIQASKLDTNVEKFYPAFFYSKTTISKVSALYHGVIHFVNWWNEYTNSEEYKIYEK